MRQRVLIFIIFSIISFFCQSQDKKEMSLLKKINKAEIKAINLTIDESYKSNDHIDLKISLINNKNKVLIIPKSLYNNCFYLESDFLRLTADGTLRITSINIDDQDRVQFKIVLRKDVNVYFDTTIALNHIGNLTIDGCGNKGIQGVNGEPIFVEATFGLDGKQGGQGENGHDLEVFVKAVLSADSVTLLYIKAIDLSHQIESYFIINPSTDSINIKSNGGTGGKGGTGNRQTTSHGGNMTVVRGGNGGKGGTGGNAGKIKLFIDDSAKNYASIISIECVGGEGGMGGRPYFAGEYSGYTIVGNYKSYSNQKQFNKKGLQGEKGYGETPTVNIGKYYFTEL